MENNPLSSDVPGLAKEKIAVDRRRRRNRTQNGGSTRSKTKETNETFNSSEMRPRMFGVRKTSIITMPRPKYPVTIGADSDFTEKQSVEAQLNMGPDQEHKKTWSTYRLVRDNTNLATQPLQRTNTTFMGSREIKRLWKSVMANEITKHAARLHAVDILTASFAEAHLAPRNIKFDFCPETPLPRFPKPTGAADGVMIDELTTLFREERLLGYRGGGRDNLLNFIIAKGWKKLEAGGKSNETHSCKLHLKWAWVVADKLIIKTKNYAVHFPPEIQPSLSTSKIPSSTDGNASSSFETSQSQKLSKAALIKVYNKYGVPKVITNDAQCAAPPLATSSASKVFTPHSSSCSEMEMVSTPDLPLPKSVLDAACHVNVAALNSKMSEELSLFTPVSTYNSTSPYLTITFDDRAGVEEPNSNNFTQNKLAAHSSVALFNRFQLHKRSLESRKEAVAHDSTLQHFGITVDNQDAFTIFVFKPVYGNDGEWGGCVGTRYFSGELTDPGDLAALADFVSYVQETFLDFYIKGIVEDFNRLNPL